MRGSLGTALHHSLLAGAAIVAVAAASPAAAQTRQFNLPAQEASRGIPAFARQAGVQILASGNAVANRRTNAVRGAHSVEEGLRLLLQGTGLTADAAGPGGIITIRAGEAPGEAGAGSAAAEDGSAEGAGIAEILVVGNPSLNADIRRSEDDAQPYVIFSQDEIRRSNATNIDDFLRTRLPQNTQRQSVNQTEVLTGLTETATLGRIDLRGLGTNQTLVLIDGRRQPGGSYFQIQQANVNGIPLSAIERIEVLPSTAGAIYGGSAVGGVVNIVLRRDFRGIEARLDYGNTFDGATGDFKASLLGGFGFGGTRIMFRASRERTADLLLSDRNDFLVSGREFLLANNPNAFAAPLLLTGGATGNICASTATGNGSCNGAQLVFDNGTPLGASITYIPDGYAGPASDGGAALLANAGRYSIGAPPDALALVQGSRMESLGLNVTQKVTDWLQLFADGSWDRVRGEFRRRVDFTVLLQANAPNNPFQQPIRVVVPLPNVVGTGMTEVETLRLNGGLIARLPWGWSASLEQGWNRGRNFLSTRLPLATAATRTLLAPYAMADVGLFPPPDVSSTLSETGNVVGPVETTSVNTSLRLAGPLFALPGGRATATLLAERREDRIDRTVSRSVPTAYIIYPARHQEVRSLYLETRLPLVSAANDVPFVHELELQGSIRYDHYETLGTTNQFVVTDLSLPVPDATYFENRVESVDYLIGARLSPVDGLVLRGSYSTGFLPPSMISLTPFVQTLPITNSSVAAARDPRRGGQSLIGDPGGNVVQTSGGNPGLEPETSRSFSFGLILQPTALRGLRVSADYTDIRKSGEISTITLQQLLDNEDRFPGRITRGPNRPGDPAGFAGPIIAYDTSPLNIANTRIKSWDFQIDYDFETGFGRFRPYAIATRQTAFARALLPGDPPVSRLDFSDGPLRWRGNVGLNWSLGGLSLGWNMQYYDSYRVCSSTETPTTCNPRQLNLGGARVRSQSYHDLFARYEFGDGSPILAGTEIAIGVQNVFNARPPFIGSPNPTGFYSSYGDPRLRRFTLSVRRRFGL